jgi:hypothetical protein
MQCLSQSVLHLLVDTISHLMVVHSRAETLGLNQDTLQSVRRIADLHTMVSMMRNILHLAASFSPLIALVPKKFTVDSIRRDHLLAVS